MEAPWRTAYYNSWAMSGIPEHATVTIRGSGEHPLSILSYLEAYHMTYRSPTRVFMDHWMLPDILENSH